MFIEVLFDDEVLFNGDAEDFLAENDYDEELECFLDNLERCKIGTKKSYFGNQGMKYKFEKIKEPSLWED